MDIQCFLLQPTDRVRRYLRRYASGSVCPADYYHNAEVQIEDGPARFTERGSYWGDEPIEKFQGDARWPAQCTCGYVFAPEDSWQISNRLIYLRSDNEQEITLPEAPAGAMWFAGWLDGYGSKFYKARGGGPHLLLKTPGGDWDIDAKSKNGEGWERSGDPPFVTAKPSIQCNNYHGWLRNGVLVDA